VVIHVLLIIFFVKHGASHGVELISIIFSLPISQNENKPIICEFHIFFIPPVTIIKAGFLKKALPASSVYFVISFVER